MDSINNSGTPKLLFRNFPRNQNRDKNRCLKWIFFQTDTIQQENRNLVNQLIINQESSN